MNEDSEILMLDFFPYILELTNHYQQFKCQLRPQQISSPIFLESAIVFYPQKLQ